MLAEVGGNNQSPGHHRKSNSTSVNNHALNSGKQQMGQGTGGNMKFVKPSELSLDFINPSGMRGLGVKGSHGIHNNTTLAGPNTSNHQMSNNQNM